MTTIGLIGLGSMGRLMAKRLIAAGHDVAVWNRTPAAMDEFESTAATVAASAREAVAGRQFVITMLTGPDAVFDVLFGEHDAAAAFGDGATLIEMSTIGPDAVLELRKLLPGTVRLIDAPVQGSLPQATSGTLRISVGGDDAVVSECEPVLSELGTVHHVGPLSSGARLKLVVNAAMIASYGVMGEALALARSLELDPETVFDTFSTTAVSSVSERVRQRMGESGEPTRFALGLAEKDLRLSLQSGLPADGIVAAAQEQYAAALSAGLGEKDFSVIVEFLRGSQSQARKPQ